MVKSAFSNCLLLLAAFAFSCKPEKEVKKPIIHPQLIPHLNQANKPFPFGVASGDPQLNSLVIWTKYLADSSQLDSTIRIDWELSANREFSKIFDKGTINTNRHKDFTVKANVEGLEANSTYYYRFRVGSTYSEIGEGKTLGNQEGYKVAFVSCSNYEWGYFNAYRLIAQDSTIDLVVHLGDYIYEYGIGKYGDTTINRLNVPEYEIISLDDYRTRYALYRLDPDLKLLHQKKSMINIWDDHELANNAYMTGAQNHDSTEGDWTKRKAAAAQAFHEWLPIQHPNTLPIYRNFKGGSLFNLLALDTRLAGRTVQVENPASANFSDSSRAILGKDQFNWMQNQLQGEQRWNIVANQVPFGPMKFVGKDGPELYMDGWDGYPYEREKMLQFLENIELKNTVFVTGDFHRAFVLENDLNGDTNQANNVSVEFVVTSISSSNDDEYATKEEAMKNQLRYMDANANMRFANTLDNGFFTLEFYQDSLIGEYTFVRTVKEKDLELQGKKRFVVNHGKASAVIELN